MLGSRHVQRRLHSVDLDDPRRDHVPPLRVGGERDQVSVDLRLWTAHRLDISHDRVRAVNRLRGTASVTSRRQSAVGVVVESMPGFGPVLAAAFIARGESWTCGRTVYVIPAIIHAVSDIGGKRHMVRRPQRSHPRSAGHPCTFSPMATSSSTRSRRDLLAHHWRDLGSEQLDRLHDLGMRQRADPRLQ